MKYHTHIASAAIATTLVANIFSLDVSPIQFWSATVIGSTLPDIDTDHSFISNKIRYGGKNLFGGFAIILDAFLSIIRFIIGHRGITHSLLFTFLFSAFIYKFLGAATTVVFGVAYTLHLVTDSMTPSGVKWFYPLQKEYRWFGGKIPTGSIMEYGFFALCLIAIGFLYRYEMIV